MSEEHLAKAFNEWMRRYIEEPERYEREITTVLSFLQDEQSGVEPSYGARQAAYLNHLLSEAAA